MTKRKRTKTYLDGLLEATMVVAEVTSLMSLAEMNQQTWEMILKINSRLFELAAEEATRLVRDIR